jgi:hypothetical protein
MSARMSLLLAATAPAAALGASWPGAATAAARPASTDPNLFAVVSGTGSLIAGSPGSRKRASSARDPTPRGVGRLSGPTATEASRAQLADSTDGSEVGAAMR